LLAVAAVAVTGDGIVAEASPPRAPVGGAGARAQLRLLAAGVGAPRPRAWW